MSIFGVISSSLRVNAQHMRTFCCDGSGVNLRIARAMYQLLVN